MKKIFVLSVAFLSCISNAALQNSGYMVNRIDLMSNATVVWVDSNFYDLPVSCNKYAAFVCENSTSYCKSVRAAALSAKAIDHNFEFDGICISSSFRGFNRFGMVA